MHIFADKHNNKVLLLHIPKCAGTSCGQFLHKYARNHKWYNLKDGYYNDHIPIQVANQIVDYDYAIAFVRNPYTRFLSKYSYLTKYNYHLGYESYTIDKFIKDKPNLKDLGCWTPEGWRKQIEYINDDINIYKIEEHNPIDVLNDLIGTNYNQEKANKTEHSFYLTKRQKEKIYEIYKEDFKGLNYENLH